jgi:hypothetical protein
VRPGGYVLAADLASDALSAAMASAPGFALRENLDVTDDVAFTVEALQRTFEAHVRPYHELVLAVLGDHAPPLREAVERTLGGVDNVPLKELFAGRFFEHDVLRSRRYRVFLLQRTGAA